MTTPINNCECDICLGLDNDFDKTTFPVERASKAKPDQHVIMWQAGNYCTITSCKAFALKVQAHEDYIKIWQDWLKKQIDENVPVNNIIRHPFCPTENIPTVEWLKNVDNFQLLRSYLLVEHDYTQVDDKYVNEEAMMKYIYGLHHFATIRVCFHDYLEGLPYYVNREMRLLDIYYDWEIEDRLKARIPISDYDLGDIRYRQSKQKMKSETVELPQLIHLKMK